MVIDLSIFCLLAWISSCCTSVDPVTSRKTKQKSASMAHLMKEVPYSREHGLDCRFTLPLGSNYSISTTISASIGDLSGKFAPTCPCAFDRTEKCRQAAHMCTTSMSSRYCRFTLKNILVSTNGGLFQTSLGYQPISLAHPSISGLPPQYYSGAAAHWLKNFPHSLVMDDALTQGAVNLPGAAERIASMMKRSQRVDILVPLRMPNDDCFNHLSFQSIPLFATVIELFPAEVWRTFYWQCSLFTAALLELFGIPRDRLVVERSVIANEVILPWVPGWNPLRMATMYGIAGRLTDQLTTTLLNKKIVDVEGGDVKRKKKKDTKHLQAIVVRGAEHLSSTDLEGWSHVAAHITDHKASTWAQLQWENVSRTSETRYVVYFKRYMNVTRAVVNEKELLDAIESWLPPHLKLVVLGHTVEYKTVEALHRSWQRYARIVSKARILIGPHGGALNNLMWMPADCDVIEFNEFPDDETSRQSHGRVAVRTVFLNAFWAKGSETGRFWIVEASFKHPKDFYMGKMRMCVLDVLETMLQIQLGVERRRKAESKSNYNNITNNELGSSIRNSNTTRGGRKESCFNSDSFGGNVSNIRPRIRNCSSERAELVSRWKVSNWDCDVIAGGYQNGSKTLLPLYARERHSVWPGGRWSPGVTPKLVERNLSYLLT